MKVVFLGVGEAFDTNIPNNSHLVLSESKVLLDCGYSVPQQLWKHSEDPDFLDAIHISHRHADHYFGLAPLLYRMKQDRRKKPMTVVCQKDLVVPIKEMLDLGYRELEQKVGKVYDLRFVGVEEGETIQINELSLSFAPTVHIVPNYAVRVSDGVHSVCYSGDGNYNGRTEELYEGSDLVIHEAFLLDKRTTAHGCITDVVEMAKRNGVGCLALTHLDRNFRRHELDKARRLVQGGDVKVIIPEPGDTYNLR